jgi:hypothetical protein
METHGVDVHAELTGEVGGTQRDRRRAQRGQDVAAPATPGASGVGRGGHPLNLHNSEL